MNCQDAAARLCDPAAGAEPELRAHLESCPDCRATAADVEALQRSTALPARRRSTGFPSRVKAAHVAHREKVLQAAPLRGGILAGALGAAGVVLVVLTLRLVSPSPQFGATVEPGAESVVDDCLFGAASADALASDLVAGDDLSDEDDYS